MQLMQKILIWRLVYITILVEAQVDMNFIGAVTVRVLTIVVYIKNMVSGVMATMHGWMKHHVNQQ